MKSSFPKKFKSLRDKNGTHRRSKSSEPSHKVRPLSADVFFSYFKGDAARQAAREEAEKERIEANVDLIANRIDELRFHNITKDHIRFALLSRYSDGNVDKAIELIQLQQQAFSGILLPYNPDVEMLGAENRGNVTCYLDALLFAMYAKLEAFDCMLKNDQLSENQRNLAALIRLWVNMLRSGKLVRTDMTETMQDALASCGWQDARLLEQQDTSEAFAFITETLQLPLLTLQVDLFHQGRGDADDHKVVYERLLNLAVPPDPEGKGVKLEDCLEDYFNTRVDVLRDSLVEKKAAAETAAMARNGSIDPISAESSGTNGVNGADSADAIPGTADATTESADATAPQPSAENLTELEVSPRSTFRIPESVAEEPNGEIVKASGDTGVEAVKENAEKTAEKTTEEPNQDSTEAGAENATASPIPIPPADHSRESFNRDPAPVRRWTMLEPHTLVPEDRTSSSASDSRAIAARQRSASIIQRIVIEDGKPPTPQDPSSFLQQFKRQGSTMIKAVTIPAWQFFRLIPWHSTSNREPQSDVEVVRQFNKRPVVGICLKRYTMNDIGQFLRQNTYIDIPDSLRLPYFMMGEDGLPREANELNMEYKLVLQSVVCHRGVSLHSGHYISFARVNPKLLTSNRQHDFDPPPDYEEEQWVKFDDLALESRVTYVEDIKAALKEEMPYLLFYQIVPMVDLSPSTTDVNDPSSPPSYNASTTNAVGTPLHSDRLDVPGGGDYFDSTTWGGSTTTGPSIRFSSELDQARRFSLDGESNTSSSFVNAAQRKPAEGVSRRGSAAFTGSAVGTPAITPEGGRSPIMLPSDEPTTAQRLSRAAARLTGKTTGRSRPPSQAGEGRISLTMSRLGGLVRPSKDSLRLPEEGEDASMATISVTPSDMGSVTALTTVHTAPAATSAVDQSQETIPAADSLSHTLLSTAPHQPAQDQVDGGHDDRVHHHHYHPHLHHHHHRRKGKDVEVEGTILPDTDGVDPSAAAGSNKGKDKDKTKGKMGVPERECSVM